MSRYHSRAIEELKDQQVRFAPREVRLAQMRRAENLVHELDAEKTYRYGEICRRVTNTNVEPTRHAKVQLKGDEVIHDLRCFVEDLSESIDMSPDTVGEPVFTIEDLAKRFNVSSKTVDRWRDRGLVSRRFRFGKRKQIGFLKSSVDRFIERNAEDVRRGSSFGQIDEKQREQIVRMAREMLRSGMKATEICRRLDKRFGRSAEAIRYTLKKYDQQHPENAVFPSAKHPLTEQQKALLLERFRSLGNAVLLGTASYWQGVDVQGSALSAPSSTKCDTRSCWRIRSSTSTARSSTSGMRTRSSWARHRRWTSRRRP